jgi:hypothetical protein
MESSVFILNIIGISFMGICAITMLICIIIKEKKRNKILIQETNGISSLLFFIITRTVCKFTKRIPDKRTQWRY